MEYILAAEPIKVHGAVVASYGSKSLSYFAQILTILFTSPVMRPMS